MLSTSEWITIFVVLYAHLLAPNLPGPIETLLRNPLVKTLGVFWFIFYRTHNWKFSLIMASGIVVLLEGSCYLWYGREAFCDAAHKNRWCPNPDLCFDELSKTTEIEKFLDNTDDFIKKMYEYTDAEMPDEISTSSL